MEALSDEERHLKLVKFSNNVEAKRNEEVEVLEVCMEKYINLCIFENFQNIRELYLVKNNITDITPLFKCTSLTVLFLQINKIKSVLGINTLMNLEKLNLFHNELTENFIKIEENKKLTYIDLSDNKIENIDFFSNTKWFVHINIANNQVRSLDPLKNNVDLQYLDVSGNRIHKFEDVQALHSLHKLIELHISSIYYRSNLLADNILYKHYFFTNFPNIQVLDHEQIENEQRKAALRDIEKLDSLVDFKINLIREKYKKEKYYLLFINNKNVSYLNEVLKPFHSLCNGKEFLPPDSKERESISKMKNEINFLLSAYTARFNYIMRRLKEERDLQIRYMKVSRNSYFAIFFKEIPRGQGDFKKVEDLIKLNFSTDVLKSYFVDDVKIENVTKVNKLSHKQLDGMIEEHLSSLIYEKKLLFLHPYNYCKINEFYEFDNEEKSVEDSEKKKFFEKNYICSCYNINHVLKTLIRIFLEDDLENDLVHLIYHRRKKDEDFANLKNSIYIKKKIVKNRKVDLFSFPIYVVESYFFPNLYKEVTAYSTQGGATPSGGSTPNGEKFKIYYTLPEHTNLKYIINVSLSGKGRERNCEAGEANKEQETTLVRSGWGNFLNYDGGNYGGIPGVIHSNEKVKRDLIHCIMDFDSVSFFDITRYFIRLSKVICEIKKNIGVLLAKHNFQHTEEGNQSFREKIEVCTYEDIKNLHNNKITMVNANESVLSSLVKKNRENDDSKKIALYLNSFHISKISLKILYSHFRSIKELYLRNNNISNLHTFFQCEQYDLENLVLLDLSFNCIAKLTPIYTKFTNLAILDLSFNYLYDYNDVVCFSKHHKKIERLSIQGNSIYVKPVHYSNISLLFPLIKTFNGLEVIPKREFVTTDYFISTTSDENTTRDISMLGEKIIWKEVYLKSYEYNVRVIDLSELYTLVTFWDFSKCENLVMLNLSNNGIEDMDNLKLPKRLRCLNVTKNNLKNVNFLKSDLEIEKIILDNNEISNINKVVLLKNLKTLRCSHNKLTEIPLLQNLRLKEINIHNNFVKDITPLVLFRHKKTLLSLNIYNNKISLPNLGLYLMHIFPNLLILNDSHIERKNNTEKFFKKMYTLDVFFDIYNLYPPYTSLHSLEIKNLKIRNILFNIDNDNFPALHTLDLSNNYINTIANVGPLDGLKVLILRNNKHINEYSFVGENNKNALNSFMSLEELDVSFCLITKMSFLKGCPNLKRLKSLNLESNNIGAVKHLSTLEGLKSLNLSNNKISKVCCGSFPTGLESLDISNNLIRSLGPFSTLQSLVTLDLRVNRIDNIDEFTYLQSLVSLKMLYLNGNRKIKENFLTIRNILKQVESFDSKIMKEQEEIVTQQVEEKKELPNKTNRDNYKKGVPSTAHMKSAIKQTKPMVVARKKGFFDGKAKVDDFTVVGKKFSSNGNY
ncbi:leucine-rich repeat protein [Plasmodium ovale]|uniref:Leucine-rich repeat protein n=1 Tax=Plasmodium ovale TaxID=36330 RepID=A0A1D3TMH7_PLAOA|nr:leucine-rich repeat protein [Plasmodium ovale]